MAAQEITQEEVARAYYKAKVDLFYSNDDRSFDLLEYEDDLEDNLDALRKTINSVLFHDADFSEISTPKFLGSAVLMAKSLEVKPKGSLKNADIELYSHAHRQWQHTRQGGDETLEFRLLSRCSIDMHILSTLWIELVGEKFDRALGLESADRSDDTKPELQTSAYGNRLRRTRTGDYHKDAPGTLKPYLFQYQRWQRSGHQAIVDSLDKGEDVVVLTSDVQSFYPSINPKFLIHSEFLDQVLQEPLNRSRERLHQLFTHVLCEWREQVASDYELPKERVGLPIGMAASGLVANVALVELDRWVREQINPVYYGRYVDDVTLVLRGNSEIDKLTSLCKWLTERSALGSGSRPLLTSEGGQAEETGGETHRYLQFHRPYFGQESKICFSEKKSRFFYLSGNSGKLLLQSLKQNDYERASEWRELPELPNSPDDVGRDLIELSSLEGDTAAALKSAERIVARRAEFALKLRNIEAYAKDLDPSAWKDYRASFFNAVNEFILTPPLFFSLERFLPRIILVALNCNDEHALNEVIAAVSRTYVGLLETTDNLNFKINGEEVVSGAQRLEQWGARLHETILRTLLRGAREDLSECSIETIQAALEQLQPPMFAVPSPAHERMKRKGVFSEVNLGGMSTRDQRMKCFRSDLAATPLRLAMMPASLSDWVPELKDVLKDRETLDLEWPGFVSSIKRRLAQKRVFRSVATDLPEGESTLDALASLPGALFGTRPPTASEIYAVSRFLSPTASEDDRTLKTSEVNDALLLLRGYQIAPDIEPAIIQANEKNTPPTVLVSTNNKKSSSFPEIVDIGLAMLSTSRDDLAGALHGAPSLTLNRYMMMIRLVNQVIRDTRRPSYLLLPELSMPVRWFHRIANKLRTSGVSLIAGVEYQRSCKPQPIVRNQVWASLTVTEWGFPSNIIYVQDKLRPAHGEEYNLLSEVGATLEPELSWPPVPVVDHRGFRFAILICSELTNLKYRGALRGNIDALFVPEWNKDTVTFNAIVESAAYDINCFIVQANNRDYGDTRIRAPYKSTYERDVVKVKGGTKDNVIVGRIKVGRLRKFQSRHSAAGDEFKPLPDGFEISNERNWWASCSRDGDSQ